MIYNPWHYIYASLTAAIMCLYLLADWRKMCRVECHPERRVCAEDLLHFIKQLEVRSLLTLVIKG